MQKPTIFFFLFALLFVQCKTDIGTAAMGGGAETNTANSLISALKNKNEEALWSLFLQENELREMLKMQGMKGDTLKEQTEDLWAAMQGDKGNQLARFSSGEIQDWAAAALDSVRVNVKKPHQKTEPTEADTEAEGMGTLHLHLNYAGQHVIMQVPCLKMKSGSLFLAGYPRFKQPEPPMPKPSPEDSVSKRPDER